MAYTIRLKDPTDNEQVARAIRAAVDASERFTASVAVGGGSVSDNRPDDVTIRRVRLRATKSYCGQHPGECFVSPIFGPREKRRGRWLEWDDWVAFHALVNDVLDRLRVDADAWTVPAETLDRGERMYVRRGLRRRVQFDWTESGARLGPPLRVWNHGTDDQFADPPVSLAWDFAEEEIR